MNDKVRLFIKAYFSPELDGYGDEVRKSLDASPSEYRDVIKVGLAEIMRDRSLSVVEFCRITDANYGTEDEMYADIARAYEALFNEPAPK